MGTVADGTRHRGGFGAIQADSQLDEAIRLIGECDIRIDEINGAMQMEINEVKAAAKDAVDRIGMERSRLLALAETYVVANKERLLGKRKAVKRDFGKLGWRKLPAAISLPKKGTAEMDGLVRLVRDMSRTVGKAFSRIRIRVDQWLTKADLNALSDSELAYLGLKRSEGQNLFFVDPDRDRITETQPAQEAQNAG